jgi:hypothetical protein
MAEGSLRLVVIHLVVSTVRWSCIGRGAADQPHVNARQLCGNNRLLPIYPSPIRESFRGAMEDFFIGRTSEQQCQDSVESRCREEKKAIELPADPEIAEIKSRQKVVEEQRYDRLRVLTFSSGPACNRQRDKRDATYPSDRLSARCKPGREEHFSYKTWSRNEG